MFHSDKKIDDLKAAYIGGGSRGWAWGFMKDLALDPDMDGEVRLYDIDHEAAEKNKIIGGKISAYPDAKARWRYTVSGSLREALTGADFVVISILPGTFKEMRSDVHEPEKYGIWQSVGDTAGPGGLVRALRTIPMFEEIGRAVRDYIPEAWVINYTNPMALCVRTLYEVFPEVKAFDCSHRVKFDLFLRYGLIAAAGDRHLAEFMPPWYLRDPETVRSWGFGLTPVDWREQDLQNQLDRSQIPNLPLGAVVETNALFRRDEIAPVYAGNMPGPVLALEPWGFRIIEENE